MKKRVIAEKWVIFALISFLAYFFVNLLMKFLSHENPYLVSLQLYLASALFMFFFMGRNFKIKLDKKSIWICIATGISSMIATIFSLKALSTAPNPGYAVAIFSSSYVLIAIISPFVFKSSLDSRKVIGIIATLIGLVLLSVEGKFVFDDWVIFAFLAFIFAALVNLLQKYVANNDPYSISFVRNLSAFAVVFIIFITHKTTELLSTPAIIASIAGFCSGIGTVFAMKSIRKAPNPGYSIAIYSSNYVLLTIVAIFIFGSSLSVLKISGVIATLIGLVLLSIK